MYYIILLLIFSVYAELQDMHVCSFKDEMFHAVPKGIGPILIFTNVDGHYTMDFGQIAKVYATQLVWHRISAVTTNDKSREQRRRSNSWSD